jgi:hypothetical protein
MNRGASLAGYPGSPPPLAHFSIPESGSDFGSFDTRREPAR